MPVQHINTDGGSLAVDVQGTGPLVLCAPAMGDTREAYDQVTSQLVNQGFTVANIDNRGHGESSVGFKRYGDEATGDDFILVAETLLKARSAAAGADGSNQPEERVALAGCSFTAGSATIAAGRRPDLVAGIILLGPFLRLPSVGAAGLFLTSMLFKRPWGPATWKWYAATLWPGLGAEGAKERAAASTKKLTSGEGRWKAFQATVAGADHRVVAPWIPKVKAGVLVVMGEKDPDWSDPKKEAEWVASNFTEVRSVMVPEAGHAPMLEKPELVGKEAIQFLQGLRDKGAFNKVAAA